MARKSMKSKQKPKGIPKDDQGTRKGQNNPKPTKGGGMGKGGKGDCCY